MSNYSHLLSPIKVGNLVLKNRMISSNSTLHFLQGPEPFPAEGVITHLARRAKAGAAMVTCRGTTVRGLDKAAFDREHPELGDLAHMPRFQLFDLKCQNYLSQMADAIHFHGAKAIMNLDCLEIPGYDVSAGMIPPAPLQDPDKKMDPTKELTEKMINEIADAYAEQAFELKGLGFDAALLHFAYGFKYPARFLSKVSNKRTDKFGGTLENRVRFPLMICDRIKEVCGQDYVIEVQVSAEEWEEGGFTLDDTIEFAKMAEGHIDILQLRAGEGDESHPTGFNLKPRPFLHYAEAVKESGARLLVSTISGYHDAEANEEIIASGKSDLIAMARSWISNVDYGRKIYEKRTEDIVPCIRCNKCHVVSLKGPWVSVCSVNPVIGIEHRLEKLITPSATQKKVAIVGGGPAGMEAALVAADRGHKITLFEKTDSLGGLLKHSDYADFKWPVRDFKNYLIRKTLENPNITINFNTEATREMLNEGKFDAVLVGVGSTPVIPPIPGLREIEHFTSESVFGHEDALGPNVVIIGGGEIGVETGIQLAKKGHKAHVIEMQESLAADCNPIHYRSMFQAAWEAEPNFSFTLKARCTNVCSDSVTYIDETGKSKTIKADSIVVAVGMKAETNAALELYGDCPEFSLIGDCTKVGSLPSVMRSAFSTASAL